MAAAAAGVSADPGPAYAFAATGTVEPSTVSAPHDPSRIIGCLGYHHGVSVRFTPPTPPRQRRLEHVRDLWQMHRLQKPQAILTAAIYQTDTGLELRVGFSLTNLIHSELSRKGDAPPLERAEDLRTSLVESGWVQLFASGATH